MREFVSVRAVSLLPLPVPFRAARITLDDTGEPHVGPLVPLGLAVHVADVWR